MRFRAVGVAGGMAAVLVALTGGAGAGTLFSGTPPAPSVKTLLPGTSAPDPMVAAGPHFLVTSDTGTIEFFRKPTATRPGRPVTLPGESDPRVPVTHFFAGQIQAANTSGKLPAAACGSSSKLPAAPRDSNPENFQPNNAGCLLEAYDTRVRYDVVRNRFWIVSAVRNWLWTCSLAGASGVLTSSVIPGEESKPCHLAWKQAWPRRMLGVAVSKTSNPRDGFHKFLLDVNDYEDWPQFMLHDHYLVVTHKDTPNSIGCACVFVFDAETLANPPAGLDNSALVVKPLSTLPYLEFRALSGTSSELHLVQNNAGRHDLTYIWTPVGNSFALFALWSRHPARPTDIPRLLFVGKVDLKSPIGSIRSEAVFRRNALWFGAHTCAVPQLKHDACAKYNMELYAFGVIAFGKRPHFILALVHDRVVSADSNSTTAKLASYESPALDINRKGDVLVVYNRTGLFTSEFTKKQDLATEVRFLVWRHGAADITSGRTLKAGTPSPTLDPGGGGVVDLGAAATDPDGRTIWVSQAFGTSTGYAQAVGAVTP